MNDPKPKINPSYSTLDYLDESGSFASVLGYASIVIGLFLLATIAFLFFTVPLEDIELKFGLFKSIAYLFFVALATSIVLLLWLGYSLIQFSRLAKEAIKLKKSLLLEKSFYHLRI